MLILDGVQLCLEWMMNHNWNLDGSIQTLLGLSFASILAQHTYAADVLVATELLGRPTDHSITLNAIAGYEAQAYVKYGLVAGQYTDSTPVSHFAATDPMVIEISGLQPNAKYWYRLCYRKVGSPSYTVRDEYSFQTQRAPGSTFSFNIIADAHMHDKKGIASVMNQTMANQALNMPDFLIDMGDNFGDDHNPTTITKDELWYNRLNMRQYYDQIGHSAATYLVMGNHEGESGYWLLNGGINQMALQATLGRKFYYNNPEPNLFYSGNTRAESDGINLPQNYYAWTWGDALFVVLDAYRGYTTQIKPKAWDWTLGREQYDWFKSTLESSQAKYKFVFAHHVSGETRGGLNVAKYGEWGGYSMTDTSLYEFDSQRPGWGLPIHQLMVKNHVNIFFQGHDHLYAREMVDGIVYQTCPMPSDSSYRIGIHDNGDAFVSDTLEGSGHLRVTVSPEKTSVDFVTAYLAKDESPTRKNNAVAMSYSVTEQGVITAIQDSKSKVTEKISLSTQTFGFETAQSGPFTLEILDLTGQRLGFWKSEAMVGSNILRFDNQLPAGNYWVRLQGPMGLRSQSFSVR